MAEDEGAKIDYAWRGEVSSSEVNALHAEAFATRLFSDSEWDWRGLLATHSLGWVVARRRKRLVGFANVAWDGLAHAVLLDVMVAESERGAGVGRRLVEVATEQARSAGCEWLHVDFEEGLEPFYLGACGFTWVPAGLIRL